MTAPTLGSTWEHLGYGKARVITISQYFDNGQFLVTVEWFGRVPHDAVRPMPISTYPLDEFLVRFEAVTE